MQHSYEKLKNWIKYFKTISDNIETPKMAHLQKQCVFLTENHTYI